MYMAYVKSKRMGSKKRRVRKTRRIKGGGNQDVKTLIESDQTDATQETVMEPEGDGTKPTIEQVISAATETKTKLDSLMGLLEKMKS